ncbi:MAG: Holliday junction branch migration DNA helicase RuvB [Sulfurimonas sp.]|uniref:Holliday junction branch migration DNA helicase RuvB n=1 Tax=Sulfurimonas sp. TaxID=2022749 RepID=UPI002612CBE0|nr:Holliday junction branch migration DNA helicase RuvB [Sulfurimonas sp.]MCW8895842.1 Holliday junction branch migration DNA helicase RuvB [Sulfurimonas sp.]MCW8955195.1 Holliday junction branch migration DNA helicase RuvB [Sulfurimonas sp.]MCW9068361.1 Holliday junction branch migration DNA helicase RuvB [Sulfurimonas sp.]
MERLVEIEKFESEESTEMTLRPDAWDEYIGQEQIKKNLSVFIEASKKRNEALDHVLFFGPPGLGKTTLALIIANEMNTNIKVTAAPMIEKSGDLAALLTNLEEGDILFIDEIHRLAPAVEEILYSAMEDFRIDIIIGSGPAAQTVKIDLPRFTLIGATTRAGMLSNPLRDRFGMNFRMQFYKHNELAEIISQASSKLDKEIVHEACYEIAKRSRGTPRIALRLLRRVRDFAEVAEEFTINHDRSKYALDELGINSHGFDEMDIKLLNLLVGAKGRAMGLSTIAAALSEDEGTVEDVLEPYLIANGYLERTAKGRKATRNTYEILNIPIENTDEGSLF